MSVSKSMRDRVARTKSLARRKMISQLEKEAAAEAKTLPMSGDDGSGPKAKGSADDKYSRGDNQPKPKGDANLDIVNDRGGYPGKGRSPKSLGKGENKTEKPGSEQTLQQALDEAMSQIDDLTHPPKEERDKTKLRVDRRAASMLSNLKKSNDYLDAAVTEGNTRKIYAGFKNVATCLSFYEDKVRSTIKTASVKKTVSSVRREVRRSQTLVRLASSHISA